ncbi:MAG TPA: TetR-like C-terminal domain-containing protein [Candidatus Limnocylindrales bacterium]|nr:TetR-like C-terminal domain-containing protein [Candidatus Limnocylindrales bacterium]
MPTPPRTSLDEIVAAGRAVLETDGLEGLTMQRVATAVGIKAPSLYKRVRDRGDLVRLIVDDSLRELTHRLDSVVGSGDPKRDLAALAHAFRDFARSRPQTYGLLFARLPEPSRVDPELNARASRSIVRTAAMLAGPDDALDAARTVVAWAHGFVSMEHAGAFRFGGDVDRAFAFGIARLATAITVDAGIHGAATRSPAAR